jgi:murein DD-endopeptidase MepM/ murein hydrolase activator NlpD
MVTMPVARGFYVTSPYGQRTGQYAGMHWGTDFGNGGGSGGHPIYAVKDGTVTRAGAASGFGQWITVDHPASNGGGLTVYGHIIPEVAVGATVREGQRIGRIDPDSGTNGGVSPHLHLEWHRYVWAQPGGGQARPYDETRRRRMARGNHYDRRNREHDLRHRRQRAPGRHVAAPGGA